MTDVDAIDRFGDAPHPRFAPRLVGHGAAQAAILAALRGGRIHHAWLIGGPEGVGKATFAWRVARFVLADGGPERRAIAARDLDDIDPDAAGARRVLAGSHPDLHVLRRPLDRDGKRFRTVITVDAAREAIRFFQSTSADGGWRVCIVDAADDLDRAGANALLKLVEEPPPRCLILFVAHAPARLPATIRSRCRRLTLGPLTPEEVAAAIRAMPEPVGAQDDATLRRAAEKSGGSTRRALALLDGAALALTDRVAALLAQSPAIDDRALMELADAISGREAESAYEAAFATIRDHLHEATLAIAGEGGRLAPMIEVWDTVERARRETEALNLDKRGLVITVFGALSEALRRARAA